MTITAERAEDPMTAAVVCVTLLPTGDLSNLGEDSGLNSYETHLRRRNLTDATIERRLRCLALLRAECGDLFAVDHKAIEEFLDRRALGPVTRTNWLSHLHSFYAWALNEELTGRDPTARLTRPKLRRRLPRPIRELDYRRGLHESPSAVMTAWLLLGGHAGLRCMEIAGLAGEQYDRYSQELWIVGKGDKERTVPVHPKVADALEPFPEHGPMFTEYALGGCYSPAQVSMLIGRYFRSIGIKATAHQLRHRFASQLLEETGDIEVVAELCGHESLDTTRIYARSSAARRHRAVRLLV